MTDAHNENNKRIAKNTMLLYLRMIVVTIVSLYTARLTLRLLGVENYGINNVVGGIVGFMVIFNATMTSATQRFLAYDIGKDDLIQFRKTYSMLLNIFFIFSISAVVLLELTGPFIIEHYLVIPKERIISAHWCFQFSVLIFIFTTLNIPQQASIVAYEKMGIYAYFTFLDIFSKLAAILVLYVTPFDRLISYAALTCFMSFVSNGIIYLYCNRKLIGCQYMIYWSAPKFKEMMSYAGWNLFGSTTTVLNNHGQSILLNIFFGPIVNAAKGIADKMYSIVASFSQNFYMAVTPQIIKSYAAGDVEYTKKLVLSSSKYSYFLVGIISFPLIFNMESIMSLWLGQDMVTTEMIKFAQLELVQILVFVLETPITMAIRATGNIKKYQILVGINTLMFIPICYLAFISGFPAYTSMIILAVLFFYVQFIRVWIVRKIINVTLGEYILKVVCPILFATIPVCLFSLLIDDTEYEKMVLVFIKLFVLFLISILSFYIIGLSVDERSYLTSTLKKKFIHKQ